MTGRRKRSTGTGLIDMRLRVRQHGREVGQGVAAGVES
jgi:hypothetical protein